MAREVEALSRAGDGGEPSVVAAAIEIVAFAGGPEEYDAFVARMQERAHPAGTGAIPIRARPLP